MRVTVSMPCYLRPQRTIRAIESLCKQNINGWEGLITGDGCPVMAEFITTNYFEDLVTEANAKGNILRIVNLFKHRSGCGYCPTNRNIQAATGKNFTFLDNDDIMLSNHLEHYLSEIENTDLDFVYFNTFNAAFNGSRISELREGGIGHSELIIRTEFLKKMPPHSPEYGHDWELVKNMLAAGAKYKKAESKLETYIIKSVLAKREEGID